MAKRGRPAMPKGTTRREQVQALRAQGMTRDEAQKFARKQDAKAGTRLSDVDVAQAMTQQQQNARDRSIGSGLSDYAQAVSTVEKYVPGFEDLSEAAILGSGRYEKTLKRNYKRISNAIEQRRAEADSLKQELVHLTGDKRIYAEDQIRTLEREADEIFNAASQFMNMSSNIGLPINIQNTPTGAKIAALFRKK